MRISMKTLSTICLFLLLVVCIAHGQKEIFPAQTENDVLLDVGCRLGDVLGYGWGQVERVGHTNYRWITGLEADVFADLPDAVDTELWIRAAPLYFPDRQQVIGVYVNGRFAAKGLCVPSPDYEVYSFILPRNVLHSGTNRLTLRMGYKRNPPREKRRELSLRVDKILLRPLVSAETED